MTAAVKQKMARGEVAVAVNLAGHNPDLLEPLAKCVAQVAQHDTDAACQATTVARRRMAAIDHDDAGLLFAGHRSPPFPHRSLSDRLHPSRCRCCPE